MIGTALSRHLLNEGYNVIILSRNPRKPLCATIWGLKEGSSGPAVNFSIPLDINKMTIDATALKEADYVVHLAGAGVADKRWTEDRKKEILESRTKAAPCSSNAFKIIPIR